jgi:hypothetical protein
MRAGVALAGVEDLREVLPSASEVLPPKRGESLSHLYLLAVTTHGAFHH